MSHGPQNHDESPSRADESVEGMSFLLDGEPVFGDAELEEEVTFKGIGAAFDDAAACGPEEDALGFEDDDVERGLEDGDLMFMPPPAMTRADALGDFAEAPCTAPSTDAGMQAALDALDSLAVEAPAMPAAPYFLDATHFETRASAARVVAAVAGVLLRNDMAATFSDSKFKFKAVHYEGGASVEFRVFVHFRAESADRVVEFCRRQGDRSLWARTYQKLVTALAAQGVAPPAPVAPVADISAPLPVPADLDDEEPAGPSGESSAAQKLADAVLAGLDEDAVPALLADACALVRTAACEGDVAAFAAPAVVARLATLCGSYSPGIARGALAILAEVASLVSSERGPDELVPAFGASVDALCASLKTVFRFSDGLANFRYADVFAEALKLVSTLACSDDLAASLCGRGLDALVSRLRDSATSSKTLHDQANTAYMSLCTLP